MSETNGTGILLQLVAEEQRLVCELNAVRAAIGAYKKFDPKDAVPVETLPDRPAPKEHGSISAAIRSVFAAAGTRPVRLHEVCEIVKEKCHSTTTGSIYTLCMAMHKRGELKRVSKGEYRLAGRGK